MSHKLKSRLQGEIATISECRWYNSNGRKWRGTKELLGESERGELKSWLNTQHSKSEDYGIQSNYTIANRWGKSGNSDRFYFLGLLNYCRWWLQPWNQKTLAPWKKSYDKCRQCIKNQKHHFVDKGPYSQSYGFSSTNVWMWELDHKEGCMPKNRCFWIVVLEKTLEGLLDSKKIKPVNPKGNQPWIFIGRTDTEAEAPILLPPDTNSWLSGKDPDAGKDWKQKKKGRQRMKWLDELPRSVGAQHATGDQ